MLSRLFQTNFTNLLANKNRTTPNVFATMSRSSKCLSVVQCSCSHSIEAPKPIHTKATTNKYFCEVIESHWLFSINIAKAKYIPACTNLSAFQTPTTGTFRAVINDNTNIVTTHKQQRSRQCNSFIWKFLFIKNYAPIEA